MKIFGRPGNQACVTSALNTGEFELFYQPVVALTTGEITGVEALCRWPQPDEQASLPETFIAQAEHSGFIIQLGEWVLRSGTEQVRRWQRLFRRDLRLSVNLSARQFFAFQYW